jgi:hypothetical protein
VGNVIAGTAHEIDDMECGFADTVHDVADVKHGFAD